MLPLLATAHRSRTCKGETRSNVSRRVVGVVALSFCLSGYCCRDVCDWDDPPQPTPSPPQLPTLQLNPDEINTTPGGIFTLSLTALDAFGNAVPVSTDVVTWSHSATGPGSAAIDLVPNSAGVVVGLPPSLGPEGFWVKAAALDFADAQARIRLIASSMNDRLSLPHTSGAPAEAVLLDAEGNTCLQDFRINVAGHADLGQNLIGDCGDPTEVAVFSVDHGMLFESGTGPASDPVPPWTPAREILDRGTLPPIHSVPVHFRIRVEPGKHADAEADARKEGLEIASKIFLKARVGIDFVLDPGNNIGSLDVATATDTFDPADCENSTVLTSLGVDLTTKGLYAVYVPGIKDSSGDNWKGWSCTRLQGQDFSVVVVSNLTKSPTTAAHELGHAFGLNAPLPKYGHTGKIPEIYGFDYTNVMWVGETMDMLVSRTHFSLGQAFRMNLDRHSWLVHEFSLPIQKDCQCDPYEAKECPFLFLDLIDRVPPSFPAPFCTPDPWDPHP